MPLQVWASPQWAGRLGYTYSEPAINSPGNRLWWTNTQRVLNTQADRLQIIKDTQKKDDCFKDKSCWRK